MKLASFYNKIIKLTFVKVYKPLSLEINGPMSV